MMFSVASATQIYPTFRGEAALSKGEFLSFVIDNSSHETLAFLAAGIALAMIDLISRKWANAANTSAMVEESPERARQSKNLLFLIT